ncbi:MAG: ATPase, T2SS/T4P/T4SS family [Bulleidia sp.]
MKDRLIEILRAARQYHVSDIHFDMKIVSHREIMEIHMRVNDRIEQLIPREGDERLLRYLAYRADLDVSDAGSPQSGSFSESVDDAVLSLRYSIMSSRFNRSGVLRILDHNDDLTIDDLSQEERVRHWMRQCMSLHEGLIVLSGPTGSGKTTSLYTMLGSVQGKQIFTLEDPIEVLHKSYVQIQINPEANLTYAKGIAQLMRHDPDIIMIGEIRDEEAAVMAVRSALTGHLVITSIHAQDCRTAIDRLLDLGVKKYQLQDVLKGLSSQRLVDDHKGGKTGIYEIMDENTIRTFLETGQTGEDFITLHQAQQAFEDSFRVAAWQSSPLSYCRNL